MGYVFISHSTSDSAYAEKLKEKFRQEKIEFWIDNSSLKAGEKFRKSITAAIKNCGAMIVVMSSKGLDSDWIEWEIELAKNYKKPIFPILLEGEHWDVFINLHYEDVRSKALPSKELLEKLAKSIDDNVSSNNLATPSAATITDNLETSRIRVMVVDDHDMVRKGLIVLLENFADIQIVADVGNGQMAAAMAVKYKPDVVLMDMNMPQVDGVTATRLMIEACPTIKVLACSSFADEETIQAVLKVGATGYLLKNVSGEDLAVAVRKVYKGQKVLASEAAEVLIRTTIQPPNLGHDLTEREREVLKLMIFDLNNREIGEQLIISPSTVKNHVSSILSKLGTITRTQAIALAIEHKVLVGHNLTEVEREVLKLMIKGLSDRKIAEHLTISSATVKSYIGNILTKLEVRTKKQAVAFALERKILD